MVGFLNGRQGVWPLSGEIWIDFPNQPEPLPFKDIYIQLTWEEQHRATARSF